MNIRDFIDELNLPQEAINENNIYNDEYELDFSDSNLYASIYTVLDKSDLVDLDVENIVLSEVKAYLLYIGDEFDVILEGNLMEDQYSLTIKRGE